MNISKLWKVRLFLILLGLSSIYMAHRDDKNGEATRAGVNIEKSESPSLFRMEILKKYGFGVFLIGIGVVIRDKKDNSGKGD
jgi:hypothetical protein